MGKCHCNMRYNSIYSYKSIYKIMQHLKQNESSNVQCQQNIINKWVKKSSKNMVSMSMKKS